MAEHAAQERLLEPHDRAKRHARYGLVLFLVYLLFYGTFMLINAFRPKWMDIIPAAGVNLAIWYGFALIAVALALALVYAWLCRRTGSNGARQVEGEP
jgi:uncharacterized membrane protein (DUF485 family)